jgi:hypothetical protein
MKSSCHIFFNHLGIPTQFSNYNSPVSVLHGINLYSTNLLNLFPLVSLSVSWQRIYNTLTVNKSSNHTLSVENTSTAQQRISCCCHTRLSRKLFTARCIATSTTRIHREHCCYCCMFIATCLLHCCLANGSIRHNTVNAIRLVLILRISKEHFLLNGIKASVLTDRMGKIKFLLVSGFLYCIP